MNNMFLDFPKAFNAITDEYEPILTPHLYLEQLKFLKTKIFDLNDEKISLENEAIENIENLQIFKNETS